MKAKDIEINRRIRPSSCAGRFYPADPDELRAMVATSLRHAKPSTGRPPKAVIAPHAGYAYSGPIAGSAYRPWGEARHQIRRVILVGPSHFANFDGIAACSASGFETPLGAVVVDQESIQTISDLSQVHLLDSAHRPEHALEVQLPFLQVLLQEFSIVPLLVGAARDEEVMEVLERLWGGSETRVVVSSDLSHYHDYLTALAVDAATASAIEHLESAPIDSAHACGSRAIRALIGMARRHSMGVTAIDLRNSGDTAGARDRVVGYGAFVFEGREGV